ncbi:hypothetical protein LINGRAHAP2_LOCUS7280, partial [Linum grandiflorum]
SDVQLLLPPNFFFFLHQSLPLPISFRRPAVAAAPPPTLPLSFTVAIRPRSPSPARRLTAESPSAASPLSRGGDSDDDRRLHSLHLRCWLLLRGWQDEGERQNGGKDSGIGGWMMMRSSGPSEVEGCGSVEDRGSIHLVVLLFFWIFPNFFCNSRTVTLLLNSFVFYFLSPPFFLLVSSLK